MVRLGVVYLVFSIAIVFFCFLLYYIILYYIINKPIIGTGINVINNPNPQKPKHPVAHLISGDKPIIEINGDNIENMIPTKKLMSVIAPMDKFILSLFFNDINFSCKVGAVLIKINGRIANKKNFMVF